MHVRDIALYKQQFNKKGPAAKSYLVSLWFMLGLSIAHIALDIFAKLEITHAYKWVILAVVALLGIAAINKNKLRKISMHLLYIYLTTIFIPISFFSGGGSNSFVQYFMLIYLVVLFFLMDVKIASIYAIYNFVQLEAMYVIESQFPHLVHDINLDWLVLENIVTVPIIMVIMIALITILLVLYKRSTEQIKKQNVDLLRDTKLKSTMLDITYAVTRNYSRTQLTETILGKIIDAMENAEQGAILRIEKRKAYYDSSIGYDINALKDVVIPIKETYLYRTTAGRMDRAMIIGNSERMTLDEDKANSFDQVKFFYNRSTMCAPIKLQGKIWGTLEIESKESMCFSQRDKDFIRVFTNEIEKILAFSQLLEQNENLRNNDFLTEIYNRYFFTKLVDDTINKSDGKTKIALVTCDLDNFKYINDTFGHVAGDEYLKYFVKIVKEHLDSRDIFGRTGGDEFEILFIGKPHMQIRMIMDKIADDFARRPINFKKKNIVLKFSCGIAQYNYGENFKDIILKSDALMYEHKRMNKMKDQGEEWAYSI